MAQVRNGTCTGDDAREIHSQQLKGEDQHGNTKTANQAEEDHRNVFRRTILEEQASMGSSLDTRSNRSTRGIPRQIRHHCRSLHRSIRSVGLELLGLPKAVDRTFPSLKKFLIFLIGIAMLWATIMAAIN
jgi:plasmid stability protein